MPNENLRVDEAVLLRRITGRHSNLNIREKELQQQLKEHNDNRN